MKVIFKNYPNFKIWSSTWNWILKKKKSIHEYFSENVIFERHGQGEQEMLVRQVNYSSSGKKIDHCLPSKFGHFSLWGMIFIKSCDFYKK